MKFSILQVLLAGALSITGTLAQFGGPVCSESGIAPYADCEAAVALLRKKLPEKTTECNTTVPVTSYKFASAGNCTITSYDPKGTAHCRTITHVIKAAEEVIYWCIFDDETIKGAITWKDLRVTGRDYNGNLTVAL